VTQKVGKRLAKCAGKIRLSRARARGGATKIVDFQGRTIWIADAHRGDGQRFIVHADEKLTAFAELESAIRAVSV